ncbi:nitroreductase family deazaflavin-dependent oxidoreductase [Nocardioides sp.]|uniref:nitroreductase family deazaflavin-dependent oxidoreductase n=1 Tax=Nocardioides sp. TaxID=35761 RepID=UPI00378330C3
MNPMRWAAQKLGGQSWLPRFAPMIVGSDKALQRLTRGRLTIMLATGLQELVLQVPGRKSGILRTTPLLTVPHDGGWLVVGSNWGGPKPPEWVANLRAAADPTITYRGRTIAVDAREVTGPERDRIWTVLLQTWPNYEKYAERTDRELPVFHLTPR